MKAKRIQSQYQCSEASGRDHSAPDVSEHGRKSMSDLIAESPRMVAQRIAVSAMFGVAVKDPRAASGFLGIDQAHKDVMHSSVVVQRGIDVDLEWVTINKKKEELRKQIIDKLRSMGIENPGVSVNHSDHVQGSASDENARNTFNIQINCDDHAELGAKAVKLKIVAYIGELGGEIHRPTGPNPQLLGVLNKKQGEKTKDEEEEEKENEEEEEKENEEERGRVGFGFVSPDGSEVETKRQRYEKESSDDEGNSNAIDVESLKRELQAERERLAERETPKEGESKKEKKEREQKVSFSKERINALEYMIARHK